MPPQTKPNRLLQLDGLRGIAIVLVILTHARLDPFFQGASSLGSTILSMLTHNGGIGVAILFLLSGYLMASLYREVPIPLAFLQKRYTRIFPAFLAMSGILGLVRPFWQVLPIWGIMAIVLGGVTIAGSIWWVIRRLPQSQQVGRRLFRLFLAIQGLTAIGYVLLQWKIPAAVFLQLWPLWLQQTITWLINSTMTLPLGTYISQLDGVYWSICAEVLFYLLYPRVFLPLFQRVEAQRSWLLNLAAVLAIGPFFYGLDLVAKSILGLNMLQLHLAIFFILGIIVSRFEHQNLGQQLAHKLQNFSQFTKLLISGLASAAVVSSPLVWRVIPLPAGLNSMVWSIPLTIMFFVTVALRTPWSQFLQSKVLVWLGSISYALYLTHTLTLEMFTRDGSPQTVWAAIQTLTISVLVMGLFAAVVHYFLERPYFVSKTSSLSKGKAGSQAPTLLVTQAQWLGPLMMVVSYVGLVWLAYRAPVSLLAQVKNHFQPQLPPIIPLSTQPTKLTFTAEVDNLGMILIHLKPVSVVQTAELDIKQGSETLGALRATLTDAAGQQIIQTDFPLYQIYESRFFTIGLPLQASSSGQTYTLELNITDSQASETLALMSYGNSFRTVYFLPKRTYFTDPEKLAQLILEKLLQPFRDQIAWQTLGLALPVLGIATYVSLPRKGKS